MDKSEKGYHKLILWGKLRDLILVTYELVDKLPRTEEFGLKSQMRRACVSVLSNFVEGYLKKSKKEKIHFLEIAETSLQELEAQAEICEMLKYWSKVDLQKFEDVRKIAAYFLFKYSSKIKE